ncbi:hypothetical protein D9M69_399400 [compost metagenome]
MSTPKFQVGEVVIFGSPDWPEHHGREYAVVAVLRGGEIYAGQPCDWPLDEFGYDLGFNVPEGGRNGVSLWDECVLRKRHMPGDMPFSDLLKSLVIPCREGREVTHA